MNRRRAKDRVFHSALCTLHSALNWSPRLVSRQRLLLFREALICLSYSGAKFAFRTLVVPRGNAPRSSGYQPGALLLSYRTVLISGFNPNPTGRNTKVTFGAKRIRMIRFGLKPLRTGNLP